MPRPLALALAFVLLTTAAVPAQDIFAPTDPPASSLPARLELDTSAKPQPATDERPAPGQAATAVPDHPTLSLFGSPGSDWLTLSTGIAKDFDESNDFNLTLSWSRFIVRDVEFGVEADAWYFDQDEGPALGLSATPFLRWHFVSHETWSIFTDAGIGLLVSTDDVPDSGTSFNFTPRAGFGATFRLSPDDTRLEVGLRWQHISNARITGDQANRGRDEPMLYVGIIFPF